MSRRWLLTVALFCCARLALAQDESELRVCQTEPGKYAYRIELANLILARTAGRYGERRITPRQGVDPSQKRCLALLRQGLVDLAYVPPTAERLRDFAVLPFDLHNGMLGYRVLLIHRADAQRFAQVRSLDDLRQLRGGFGRQWGDFALFARNRLPVVGIAHPENLLPMLAKRRFDYYHRGLHEAWQELQANAERYPELMVEPNLALVYDLPVFFTFNREDRRLRQRFAEGLASIRADGSFRELFLRHFGHLAELARLHERRWLPIDYPTPPGLPPRDTSLWLQP
ncbi:substrate-binding periplasmic protein [Pseudomonas sp. MBLB4123]|uniref:substrate-binding periplasmic protein n=1 Tax=Pseudomonas sp. MBLB4123 TaxID=3451557 RepID=UPI003F74FE90